jgi:hypothetical protein
MVLERGDDLDNGEMLDLDDAEKTKTVEKATEEAGETIGGTGEATKEAKG